MTEVDERFEMVFRDVFGTSAPGEISDDLVAADVPGWDSVAHINLMYSLEEEFGIEFSDDELSGFADVGALKSAVASKAAA